METLDLLRSGQLQGVQRLNLSSGLTSLPTEIFELANSLEILDLSNNALTALPDEFARLRRLKIAFFNNNAFETLPEVLSQCPNLSMIGFKANQISTVGEQALPLTTRWLILTDNQIEALPASMGQLKHLQKLMLAGNRLSTLPAEMAACTNLELVRLAANQLQALPEWLLTLPRLAWLAYAGNPCCADLGLSRQSPTPLPTIDWTDLTLGDILGQGASGIIYQGTWQQPQRSTQVAIKIFKGEITSDGFPADEMSACMAAGAHPNLVTVLGRIINHPERKNGLVLGLIPAHYTNLGGPPSLESCTRDTYPPGTEFSLETVVQIAQGITAAAAHLHSQGIMHGDLYPHNTLIDPSGQALLGDFGAASFYPADDSSLAQALEQLEVRAFGCLLEDLLDRSPTTDSSVGATIQSGLRQLQQACMAPHPPQRPRFEAITQALARAAQSSDS